MHITKLTGDAYCIWMANKWNLMEIAQMNCNKHEVQEKIYNRKKLLNFIKIAHSLPFFFCCCIKRCMQRCDYKLFRLFGIQIKKKKKAVKWNCNAAWNDLKLNCICAVVVFPCKFFFLCSFNSSTRSWQIRFLLVL